MDPLKEIERLASTSKTALLAHGATPLGDLIDDFEEVTRDELVKEINRAKQTPKLTAEKGQYHNMIVVTCPESGQKKIVVKVDISPRLGVATLLGSVPAPHEGVTHKLDDYQITPIALALNLYEKMWPLVQEGLRIPDLTM